HAEFEAELGVGHDHHAHFQSPVVRRPVPDFSEEFVAQGSFVEMLPFAFWLAHDLLPGGVRGTITDYNSPATMCCKRLAKKPPRSPAHPAGLAQVDRAGLAPG